MENQLAKQSVAAFLIVLGMTVRDLDQGTAQFFTNRLSDHVERMTSTEVHDPLTGAVRKSLLLIHENFLRAFRNPGERFEDPFGDSDSEVLS